MRSHRRWFFFGNIAYLIVLIPTAGFPHSEEAVQDRALNGEMAFDRHIEPGSTHRYRVNLPADTYLHLELERSRGWLELTLTDPNGSELWSIDTTSAPTRLQLYTVAPHAGAYRFAVKNRGRGATAYRLHLKRRSPAGASERLRSRTFELFLRGDAMRRDSLPSQRERGLSILERVTATWCRLGEEAAFYHSLTQVGSACYSLEAYSRAQAFYRLSLKFYEQTGDRLQITRILTFLAKSHRRKAEEEAALRLHFQALEMADSIQDLEMKALNLNSLSLIFSSRSDFAEALALALQAKELYLQLGNHDAASLILADIGRNLLLTDMIDEAHDAYQQALVFLGEGGDLRRRADILTEIGWTRYRSSRFNFTQEYFDRALDLYYKQGNPIGMAGVTDRLGTLHLVDFRLDEALECYQLALAMLAEARPAFSPRADISRAFTNTNLAYLYYLNQQWESAAALLEPARQILAEQGLTDDVAFTFYLQARVEFGRGNLLKAKAHIEAALGIVAMLRDRTNHWKIRNAFSASRSDYHGLLIEILMALEKQAPGQNYAAMALAQTERVHGRNLLARLSTDHEAPSEPTKPSSREKEFKQKIRALIAHDENAKTDQNLRELFVKLGFVRFRTGQAGGAKPPTILKPKQIQDLLDPETLLLVYSLQPQQGYLWSVDHQSITTALLPGRNRLEPLLKDFFGLLPLSHQRSVQGRFQWLARQLSEHLLAPVAGNLKGKRLVIVGDPLLQVLPFDALPDPCPKGHGNPLVAGHEIVYLPSASILARLRSRSQQRRRPTQIIAVFADPVFARNDVRLLGPRLNKTASKAMTDPKLKETGRLLNSKKEGLTITSLAPFQKGSLHRGFHATRRSFLSEDFNKYQILHLATHSFVNQVHPELSGFLMSRFEPSGHEIEGMVYAHEIALLNLPLDLAVLSSCRSAQGQPIRGEGIDGLARGFLSAGVSRLLASLWTVNDQTTAELMIRFYRGLFLERLSPSKALQNAKNYIRTHTQWRFPGYWAGFTMQGDWLPINF